MPCNTKALSALVSVLLSGKVSESSYPGVAVGDAVSLSFNAEREALVRDIKLQGVVHDGIAPYQVCEEDFSLRVGKTRMYLGKLPPTLLGEPSSLWFSLMQGRPVYDGAWVSIDPADGSKGFPLSVHGEKLDPLTGAQVESSKMGAEFRLSLKRGAVESLEVSDLVGSSFDASELESATLEVWRGWAANAVVKIELGALKIGKAK